MVFALVNIHTPLTRFSSVYVVSVVQDFFFLYRDLQGNFLTMLYPETLEGPGDDLSTL